MPQRPVRRSTIHRVPRTPENPPTARTGRENQPSDSPHVVWRDPDAVDRPETVPAPVPPTGGGSLPDTSGGRVCDRCGAYVVRPDVHGDWHRKLDRHIRLTLEVFQRRGYITKGGDSATGGEGDR